jgi:cation diffusion facilitator family transporter
MHVHDHHHDPSHTQRFGERRTLLVLVLTALTMVVEIAAGTAFGSMALLADGWHMGTHVAAFGITLFAYRYATRHRRDRSFAFGTGKVNALGAFASAVALAVVALMMALESIERLVTPHEIHFDEAIAVAAFGLVVNAVSAVLLHGGGREGHHRHDQNLRAAYLHVLADALTSILALVALGAGRFFGWNFLDPMMGIVGAVVIAVWARGLLRENSAVLLDRTVDPSLRVTIEERIARLGDARIEDLRVWRIGPRSSAAMLTVSNAASARAVRETLEDVDELEQIVVEVVPGADGEHDEAVASRDRASRR